jgi:hypothetical protein
MLVALLSLRPSIGYAQQYLSRAEEEPLSKGNRFARAPDADTN